MSKIDFRGRVAIVTGAGAGLGRDYAIELARRGAKLVVNDIGGARDGSGTSHGAAEKVVEEIRAFGGKAVPSYDTVATVQGGQNIVKTAVDVFGQVDILINNAGILRDKMFVNMEEGDWDAVIGVHLKGAYCVSRPAFLNMKEHGYGRIVMTSSGAGAFGNFGQTNYATAKMAVLGLTNVLKLEGEKYKIKVNAIVPNAATRMTGDVMPSDMYEKFKVEYITPAVLYLSSEQCQDSGLYINAFGGYYSRSAILTGEGVSFTDIPGPEQIMERWNQIISLEHAKFHNAMTEMVSNVFQSGNKHGAKPAL